MSLWAYSPNEQLDRDSVLMGGGDGGSEGVWGELWRCRLALPSVHLHFSPDGAMFATASKDDHFVKIWYQSRTGMWERESVHVCVCVWVRGEGRKVSVCVCTENNKY